MSKEPNFDIEAPDFYVDCPRCCVIHESKLGCSCSRGWFSFAYKRPSLLVDFGNRNNFGVFLSDGTYKSVNCSSFVSVFLFRVMTGFDFKYIHENTVCPILSVVGEIRKSIKF